MNTLEDYLNASIKKLKHNVFKDVVKIETDIKPMEDGQVVLISDVKKVKLTLTDSNGGKKQINAIAKVETEETNKTAGKKMAEDSGAFTTEIMMYGDVLKSMETLMKEVKDDNYVWPECYTCADKKFLFQDLCEIGYKIVPTHKFLDSEHTKLVMQALGKFHAMSMILNERSLFSMDELKEPFFVNENTGFDNMMEFSVSHFIKTIKESWEPEWSLVADRLEKYLENGVQKMREIWKNTKGKWDVINHGDFTIRNMLFHYSPNSTIPDSVKFVDFQMCHYSHFANDLVMILYSSLMTSVREENLTVFLTTYTDSLTNTLQIHKYKGSIPSIQHVNDALKEFSFMTTVLPLFNLPFLIETSKDDIQQKAEEYFKVYESTEAASAMVDYTDKNIQAVVKAELRRSISQHIF